MKLFKKAREAFNRMVSRGADAPPPVRPPPSTVDVSGSQKVSTAQVILDPRYKYQLAQRDFEMRAKATTILHTGGTLVLRRNVEKRVRAAYLRSLHGMRGGWKYQARQVAA